MGGPCLRVLCIEHGLQNRTCLLRPSELAQLEASDKIKNIRIIDRDSNTKAYPSGCLLLLRCLPLLQEQRYDF